MTSTASDGHDRLRNGRSAAFLTLISGGHFHSGAKQNVVDKAEFFEARQRCRSAVKYGVRVSKVKSSNCLRRLEKLVLPSILDTSLSPIEM